MRKDRRDKFQILEEIATADFVFRAYGATMDELFENCAYACFFAMTDVEKVRADLKFEFEISGDCIEDLLFNYLAELIYLKDTEKIFFSEFEVKFSSELKTLKAMAAGENINFDRHVIKTDVKAVTYHELEIEKLARGYQVKVLLDL